MIKVAYINYWKDPFNDRWFTNFISNNIDEVVEVGANENPDILISSIFGPLKNVIKLKAKVKIFFTGENPNSYVECRKEYRPENYNTLRKIFDIIIGFELTSIDKKFLRFPLWLIYYPFYNFKSENNIIEYVENSHKQNNTNHQLFCSLVSSHDANGLRTHLHDKMKKYGNIYCGGKILKNIDIPIDQRGKIELLKKCKYNICPENSDYPNYTTEKIFQALESGCIPIYWGHSKPEQGVLNENKYLFYNSKKELTLEYLKTFDQYINESVFLPDAKNVINKYYTDLVEVLTEKFNS